MFKIHIEDPHHIVHPFMRSFIRVLPMKDRDDLQPIYLDEHYRLRGVSASIQYKGVV